MSVLISNFNLNINCILFANISAERNSARLLTVRRFGRFGSFRKKILDQANVYTHALCVSLAFTQNFKNVYFFLSSTEYTHNAASERAAEAVCIAHNRCLLFHRRLSDEMESKHQIVRHFRSYFSSSSSSSARWFCLLPIDSVIDCVPGLYAWAAQTGRTCSTRNFQIFSLFHSISLYRSRPFLIN